NNQRDFDLPIARILHTSCPHHYRFGKPGESEEDFAARCAAELEEMILAEGPDTVAAFFAEPVMGAGGVIVPPRTYFERIQPILKKYDILLVADEVICGFGRTGNVWGCQTYGIKPDMIAAAKALSSAYLPISALMVSEPIYQALVKESEKIGIFGHGYTYGGHPVAAAVALETLKIYEERDILGHVCRVAPAFQKGLHELGGHPLVGEARGVGLIGALEMVRDKTTRESFQPADGVGPYLWDRLQDHGVINRVIGDVIAFAPPLVIEEDEIGDMLAATRRALDATLSWVEKQGLRAKT
ncbi:MAG: aminotransferase class III-fold pyridoxal phosphate-dependent enzyme, partial [Alphaproteobacteria bacterium]|nr:aminotransferase class III-fold pyridoxal phosphate-dependent enzyme [Alphaproteobacteria bacterium]